MFRSVNAAAPTPAVAGSGAHPTHKRIPEQFLLDPTCEAAQLEKRYTWNRMTPAEFDASGRRATRAVVLAV